MYLKKFDIDNFYILEEIYGSNIDYFLNEDKNNIINKDFILKDLMLENENISNNFIMLDETYIGFTQIMKKTSKDNCSWIGLLLIHKDYQSFGLGHNAVNLILNNYTALGYNKFRVCVHLNNERACNFWKSLGFIYISNSINNNGRDVKMYEKLID